MHYSDDQLHTLLADTPLDDFRPDELLHLEQCTTCQQRLAKICGAGDWLNDLTDRVNEPTSDFHLKHAPTGMPNSVFVAVDSSERQNKQLECEAVHLDFLESPTHPELMGRLGRYDIERLIGVGGFGIVFKARDSELNRVVAIKVLAPHLVHSGPARKRFAREAQASAAVVHEHVVPIHDVVSTDDICYLVMQFIPGSSLQERVDEQGPLPTAEILRIAAQTAAGLDAAHHQGLIHRDVKPGNVLLEDSVDRVLISDFGLARAADDASLTRSGVITGTPNYMSPEQARGAAIDARSDLFSLGSVIYFMGTGRSPFRAPNMMAVMNRICHESYRPLEEVNPELPGELIDVVDRLLSKNPDERFQDAKSVQSELSSLLSDFQSGKLRPRRAATLTSLPRKLASNPWVRIAGIGIVSLACIVALILGMGFLERSDQPGLSDSTRMSRSLDSSRGIASESAQTAEIVEKYLRELRRKVIAIDREEHAFENSLSQADDLIRSLEQSHSNDFPSAVASGDRFQWETEVQLQSMERRFAAEELLLEGKEATTVAAGDSCDADDCPNSPDEIKSCEECNDDSTQSQ